MASPDLALAISAARTGLAPGRWFKHSPSFRTVFAADEVLYVLQGAMLAKADLLTDMVGEFTVDANNYFARGDLRKPVDMAADQMPPEFIADSQRYTWRAIRESGAHGGGRRRGSPNPGKSVDT